MNISPISKHTQYLDKDEVKSEAKIDKLHRLIYDGENLYIGSGNSWNQRVFSCERKTAGGVFPDVFFQLDSSGKVIYKGGMKENKRHGTGILYMGHFCYDGGFKEGHYDGKGKIHLLSNPYIPLIFEGIFKNGLLHDQCRGFDLNKRICFERVYDEGKLCESSKRDSDIALTVIDENPRPNKRSKLEL